LPATTRQQLHCELKTAPDKATAAHAEAKLLRAAMNDKQRARRSHSLYDAGAKLDQPTAALMIAKERAA
jgi:hypothetical protein